MKCSTCEWGSWRGEAVEEASWGAVENVSVRVRGKCLRWGPEGGGAEDGGGGALRGVEGVGRRYEATVSDREALGRTERGRGAERMVHAHTHTAPVAAAAALYCCCMKAVAASMGRAAAGAAAATHEMG